MTESRGHARATLLYAELRWLMRLRWLAVVGISVLAMVDHWTLHWTGHALEFLALAGVFAVLNFVFHHVDHRRPSLRRWWRHVLLFATAQIYVDLGGLTLLVLWTGGVQSPVLGFFVFHMVFASLFQPRPRAYFAAAVSVLLVAIALRVNGQWPSSRESALQLAGWACVLWVTVFLTEHITRQLYRRELARTRQSRRAQSLAARVQVQQAALVQQEKMAAVGQLAAGVAHEIANPLANMDSVLQLMQRRPEQPRPDAIANLREQVQRITRTVRQLTSFAHPGQGKYELLPLNDVVRASLDLLRFDRRFKDVRTQLALSEDVGEAIVNRHALEQVITNLVRNALDAVEQRPSPSLDVRTASHNGTCVVEVSDNGTGIAPEHLARVFDPFFTTKPVGKGTGLGLSISRRLVMDHGGQLEVNSVVGSGTTFRILLPRTGPVELPASIPRPKPAPP